MSSTQHRTGRVHNLSQHFDSLVQTEVRDERSSPTSLAEESSSPKALKTVFTGEHRVPLRERLRAMRQGINGRKEERRKSAGLPNNREDMALLPTRSPSRTPSPLDLDSSYPSTSTFTTTAPPSTPRRSRPSPLPLVDSCPGAPVKSKKWLDLPASKSGTDADDLLFDRRAHPRAAVEIAASADKARERQRRRITTPGAPSPLRSSFNADEMAELAAQLDAMRAEIAAKEEGREDLLTPEPFKGFERFARD
ncbi:uncharacterized protein F4807DRAFT_422059 [Annulohypoxylon truncatum]|uniref:uncharacterized protein n=1 Tax=Annulohypoxylon truncatum TaxID=327061 RepID=UPI002007E194|nr:uncharacterized protein F4807DRAFT_422059 [Annulohypoxylon truncatum]KAI1210622.1 hypothetical protein F4807DRAFT_422059 [Annulohypoxylon truncatum]